MLTAELKRLLTARAACGKTISTTPQGPQNAVTDLTADNNGWGTEAIIQWTEVLQGDYDNSGSVDIGDLVPVAMYYGQRTDGGPNDQHKLIVGDDDPEINIVDLQAIAANYGAHLQGYQLYRGHFDGMTTQWEAAFRSYDSTPLLPWTLGRPSPPPLSTRPAYWFDDDVSALPDKDNIRYKVVAYGDGQSGAVSNEVAVPPLPTYVVSGKVLQGANPVPGVTLTLTPGQSSTTTQVDGTFSFSGVHYGSYTLSPSKSGVAFTPASRTVVVFGADMPGQDFAAVQPHTISGTVLESGVGLAGVVVALTPGPVTATTQADGSYTIANVSSGSYTLVPRRAQYAFTPPTRAVVVTSTDVAAQDFAGVGGLPSLAWPKFRGNTRNTGQSPYVGAQTSGLLWTAYPGAALDGCSPVIGADETIYLFSAGAHYLFALSPYDGSMKWRFQPSSGWHESTPAVSADGSVYIGVPSPDGCLYALNALDGSIEWRHQFGSGTHSSASIGPDGTIYVGSDDGCAYALSPSDGSVVRQFATGSDMYACPAISDDGTLYVGCDNGKVYAFNVANGNVKWTYQTGGSVTTSCAVGADGTIYVGSTDKNVYALNASDGTLKWQYVTQGSIGSSAALGSDGSVYVGSCDGRLYAFNGADGTLKWQYDSSPDWAKSSPAVGADGTVYFCGNNLVCALNGADGSVRWSYYTDATNSSPALGADGTVYATAGSVGRVHAFWP
jgi:outer membrane protein assembly factor BamB